MAFPKLRFKNAEGAEFTSWVTSFIGDECKITTGNKDTQNKIDGGKYPFFVRSQTVERINTYSKDCEAILTSGDGVGVGKNYHYINGKFDFHQRVYCLYDFSNQLLGKYLYIYFSNYFFDRVKRLSAKNSVDSVRMDMISKMEIKLPSLVEQTKIASFLSNVDEKISQLTQKHALLSQYKQGMMQKLFSQQIRFKADDGSEFGEWEEIVLSDVATRITRKNKEDNQNALTISAQMGLVNQQEYFSKQIASRDLTKYYLLHKGEFAYNKSYSAGYPMGAIKRLKLYEKGVVSTLYICFSLNTEINSDFFEHYVESGALVHELEKIAQEGARNHGLLNISLQEFFEVALFKPCLEEQTKIANFLSAIDQKIDVVSEQLEQAKLWKKGLLQQMFV